MKTVLISACAAALLLTAGAASAQSQRGQRIDADQDGRISQVEFLSRLDRMAAADANRDGSITAEERRAAMQARRAERRDAAFDRLDADNDGAISRAEFEARPQRAERAPRAPMGGQQVRRMHRGPAAGAPMHAARTVDLAQARERMGQAFARLDKDGDGYLTAEERREGAMQRREHRREMRRPAAPASE